ncbi:phytanoyl-CoA dioxygenase family protein [Psychrobacter alimentarius]|uniref:phytanoyl-CoA dioxygenase family protein n=1 Tax=Psychrobacter alimentarius TaxID=261164 RepID=UPI00191A8998|nr:phytanoyl-CoA dioxygenase family protein [Psychrobacter alimentarius]
MLTNEQIQQYHDKGYLVVENAIDSTDLTDLLNQINFWIDESKVHTEAWGSTLDGRARFDIDPKDHSAKNPSLRRVTSPTEISESFANMALKSNMSDMASDLIGGNGTCFHHSKINAKLPNTSTTVKWHQDFPFTPHTNDDMLTALLMIGEVTMENGPLLVVPGSHKENLFSHWENGKFVGKVSDDIESEKCQQFVPCIGKPGSICFMHSRLLHSSGPNQSDLPRYLFISVYKAEDAHALSSNPLPSKHEGALVKGAISGNVRLTPNLVQLPEIPKGASFFTQQEMATMG